MAFGTGERYYRLWDAFDLARRATLVREQKAQPDRLFSDDRPSTIVAEPDPSRQEASQVPTRRQLFGYLGAGVMAAGVEQIGARLGPVVPGLVDALDVTRHAGVSSLAPGAVEQVHRAVEHYATLYPITPTDELHDEVLGMRKWVGSLMDHKLRLDEHRELVVAAGWLSVLLGLLAFDRGDDAAAWVWCDDGRERGLEAGDLELAAWSREPIVPAIFYTGRPGEAVAVAREGLELAPKGSAVEVKLAAQEMRAIAGLGDRHGFARARRRAETSYAKLPPTSWLPGTNPFAARTTCDLPPLMGASMVLLGDWATAERLKRQELASGPDHDTPGRSIGYLDYGIALAQLGRIDEAAAAGMRALRSRRTVVSVLVQAGKLDRALVEIDADVAEVRAFHERYLEARRARQHMRKAITAN
ncbi:MAG TPA: hypothetical protein VFA45_01470 [Actinomycetes bacterium]|nr:hypothetical protein [Actinomycetes bacterium]